MAPKRRKGLQLMQTPLQLRPSNGFAKNGDAEPMSPTSDSEFMTAKDPSELKWFEANRSEPYTKIKPFSEHWDTSVEFFYKPQTLTVLLGALGLMAYVGITNDVPKTLEANVRLGLFASVLFFLVFSILQFRDGPFIRPHPAFWRAVMGVGVIYQVLLVFILFQDKHDMRQLLRFVDPELGKPLEEQAYAEDCSLTYENIMEKMDIFVIAHALGWYGKAVIIRNNAVLWILSVMFEIMELSLGHQLRNFQECWWDSLIMDVLVCNGLGIYLGMKTCQYLELKPYYWQGLSEFKSIRDKTRRIAGQFTPHDWTRFEWEGTKSFRNYVAVVFIIAGFLLVELNAFYLKTLLWMAPEHRFVTYRLVLLWLCALPGVREVYQYVINDRKIKRLGTHAWLLLANVLTEFLIIIKYSQGEFPDSAPTHVKGYPESQQNTPNVPLTYGNENTTNSAEDTSSRSQTAMNQQAAGGSQSQQQQQQQAAFMLANAQRMAAMGILNNSQLLPQSPNIAASAVEQQQQQQAMLLQAQQVMATMPPNQLQQISPEQRIFFQQQQQALLNAQRKKSLQLSQQQNVQVPMQMAAQVAAAAAAAAISPQPQSAFLQQQALRSQVAVGTKKVMPPTPMKPVLTPSRSAILSNPASPHFGTPSPTISSPHAFPKPYEPAPDLTKGQKTNLKTYMLRDELYQKALEQQGIRLNELVQEKRKISEQLNYDRQLRAKYGGYVFGKGYDGYGCGSTGSTFRIIMPHERKRPRRATSQIDLSTKRLRMAGDFKEDLIPIRLDIESEGYKLRDTFTWNLNERLVTPDQFATIICEDFKLPSHLFQNQIAKAIKEQVSDYHSHAYGASMLEADGIQREPLPANRDEELRILIKLDIIIGNICLIDQFEWDISNPRNDPELFAFTLATELGLGGEFRTAIAHSIREQMQIYTKSLFLVGYPFDGTPVQDDDLRYTFLPTVSNIARDEDCAELHTPRLVELTQAELEKLERDGERDARRKRRQTRGRRGIILPDREAPRTHRMVPGQNYIVTNEFNDETGERIIVQNLGPFRKSNSNGYDSSAVIADRYSGGSSTNVTDRGRRAKLQSGLADNYNKSAAVPPRISNRPPPNYYDYGDDEWHCLNCGVPDSIAIGRRKGPKGEKTLCGLCGIFFHKHNRNRPVEFNRDKDYHLELMSKTNPKLATQMYAKNAEAMGKTEENMMAVGS